MRMPRPCNSLITKLLCKQKEKKKKKSNQKKIERKEKVIVEYKYSPITEEEKEKNIYQEKQEEGVKG